MKNSTIIIFIALILAVGGYFVFGSGKQSVTGNIVSAEEAQEVTLGMKNYNYYPDTITVESGKKVRLTLDSSVSGCLRSFAIKDLGVRAVSSSPSQKIEFTPSKKGTFAFSCSMGMGYGKLIVT